MNKAIEQVSQTFGNIGNIFNNKLYEDSNITDARGTDSVSEAQIMQEMMKKQQIYNQKQQEL